MTIMRLGKLLRERRGSLGIREVARDIGVSPATLTRIEGGKVPDLATFRKMCAWLEVDPATLLGIPAGGERPATALQTAAVHLRADQSLPETAARDLAELIVIAHTELARRGHKRKANVSPWV